MREIKFRQENGTDRWHYWGFTKDGFISPLVSHSRGKSYQYTGLNDKNGNDIYEGDILTDDSICNDYGALTIYSIGYKDGAFRIEETNCTCGCIGTPIEGSMESRILSNICENPEVLNEA